MPAEPHPVADPLAAAGGDPFIRNQLRYGAGPAWRLDGALAFVGLDTDGRPRGLTCVGEPPAVARLLAAVLQRVPAVPRVAVPRGPARYLPAGVWLADPSDWDFRATAAPPVEQPGESRVGWLLPEEWADVRRLLDVAYPEGSTRPGSPKVRRWAGVRGRDGRLDACLADASGSGDLGHLSAIATRPRARGRGLGAAVTAWATRRLLAESCDVVTLGVYAANARARRLYDRLGFSDDHHLTGGVPVRRERPAASEASRPPASPPLRGTCPA